MIGTSFRKAPAHAGAFSFSLQSFAEIIQYVVRGRESEKKMKRLATQRIGIEQGDDVLFSDYEDGGEMWTAEGPRERRKPITFGDAFRSTPIVHCSLSMWDVDHAHNVRADVSAENISPLGFDLVFRTWGDTRVARVRVGWLAIGELANDDDWELY